MTKAARKGDIGSGHGCFPPTPAIEGSGDIIINGKPALRQGDAFAIHGCPKTPPHGRNAAQGSSTVNFNGKPAMRTGDGINCGGNIQTGSDNVFIGDQSWSGIPTDTTKANIRLPLSQTPGNNNHPYTEEPYKLYHNGALVQQGKTDEEGYIKYEYDTQEPLTGQLSITSRNIDMHIDMTPPSPAETTTGIQQRLDALGYYNQNSENQTINTGSGKPNHQYFQGDQGNTVDGEENQRLIQKLKPLMP